MVKSLTDLVFDKIEEEIPLLKAISDSLGLQEEEDQLLQYPNSTEKLYLQPGEKFEAETQLSKKLVYLSIDAPEGVLVTIYRDNQPIMFMLDEIGAIEFRKGMIFDSLKVVAENNSEIEQKWSLRMVFT